VNPGDRFSTLEIPTGPWAVAVSGGADSVALLLLLNQRPEIFPYIVHLDHQTRGDASTGDAAFVADLARKLAIPATIFRRDQIEPEMRALPKNLSARYRAVRLELFRRVVDREKLNGVMLAHHADDQAETILLRLLRGSGPAGLAAMKTREQMGGLTILRPLLQIRGGELRQYLIELGQPWREDASNQSDKYARNRVRRFLETRPQLHDALLAVGRTSAEYSRWIKQTAPPLPTEFPAVAIDKLPRMLAREAARTWLKREGSPASELRAEILDRLRQMANDAATSSKQTFPGNITIHRRRGWIARGK
jgi:tRNA(Ile)-lysidine synthetase-like protein